MAAERIFDEVDEQELLELNAAAPFGAGNAAFPPRTPPSSRFFLNDRGEPYKPTERRNKLDSYQPQLHAGAVEANVDRTSLHGATPARYRDSFIKGIFGNGAG